MQLFDYAQCFYYNFDECEFLNEYLERCQYEMEKHNILWAKKYIEGWRVLFKKSFSAPPTIPGQKFNLQQAQIFSRQIVFSPKCEVHIAFFIPAFSNEFAKLHATEFEVNEKTLSQMTIDETIQDDESYDVVSAAPIYVVYFPDANGRDLLIVDGNHRIAASKKSNTKLRGLYFDVAISYFSIMGVFERVLYAFLLECNFLLNDPQHRQLEILLGNNKYTLFDFVKFDLEQKNL